MGPLWRKKNRFSIVSVAILMAVGIILTQAFLATATNKITNGNFASNINGWTNSTAPGAAWSSAGFTGTLINAGQVRTANGGSLQMSGVGRNSGGTGYMAQSFTVTESNPTVLLSFVWKKNWLAVAPAAQTASLRILQPGGTQPVEVWTDTNFNNANSWSTVQDLDLSAYFQTPGIYEIQLYGDIKAGNDKNAEVDIWFDEIYLDVAAGIVSDTTPPTFGVEYFSDTPLSSPLPVDGNGNPITKAQTVYVRVTANEALQAPPTLTINAPATANDLTTAIPLSSSGNAYVYSWNVQAGAGDGTAATSVSGKDTAGNTGITVTGGASVVIDTTASAPVLNSTVPSMGRVDLSWSTSQTDIAKYEVHRSTAQGFTPTAGTLINGNITATAYADTSVAQNTTYYYKIVAIDKVGNISFPSNELSVTTLSDTVPPNFSVGYYSDAAMTVALPTDASGSPITKAQTVYIKTTASEPLQSAPIIAISAPGTANDKTNQTMTLVSGNSYSYAWTVSSGAANDGNAAISISGIDPGGNTGSYNGAVVVNTQISTPTGLAASAGQGYVGLTWSTPDTDLVNFKIYRSTTGNFTPNDGTNLLATIGNTTSYTDNTASYPNTYFYKVVAVDIAGNSSTPSAEANGIPLKVNPHGNYSTNTSMCSQCHTSHNSQGNNLLAGGDVTATCYLCHDAGGQSSYDVASEFGKTSPFNTSHHPVPEGTQSCNDCHNPHNNSTTSVKLLQTSTGATGGNEFCFACHGTSSSLPSPNGDHQTSYPAMGSGHNDTAWVAPNGQTPFDPDFDTTSPGKTGIGCEGCHQEHGSSLGKLLRVVDWNNDKQTPQATTVNYGSQKNNKDFCYECHTNSGRADGAAEPDNAWLGKGAYEAVLPGTPTDHAGSSSSCTQSCHQPHGNSFDPRYLSPNETGFDYLKFTYDQNFSSSRTTTYAPADFQACNQCHDLNALVNNDTASSSFTDKTRGLNLHRVHLVDAGTNGKGNAVCKECHDPHGTTAAWNPGGEHLVGFPATTVSSNTLSSPQFTDNAPGAGGKGSCDLVCHNVPHQDGGTSPAVNSTYSGDAVSSGEGGACFTCHGTAAGQFGENMLRGASFFTHPIANDAEDPNAVSPNCTTLCHAPHAQFGDPANTGGRAANLKTAGGPAASVATTNQDFDPLAANGGLCMSCHQSSQNDTLHTQPDGRIGTAPWDTNPTMAISLYRLSGHNYSVSTTISKDSSVFNANCTKCHNDTLTKAYQGGTDNSKMIGLHSTPVPWSISKFNLAANPVNTEESFCYACHGNAGGADYYGTPNAGDIKSSITGGTSFHPVQNYAGLHKRYDRVAGVGETSAGWLPSTNRHIECGDCHDPHTSGEGDSLTSGSGTPVKKPDAAVRNVEGILVDAATWSITGITPSAQRDYQVCLKCHSSWAWGSSVPTIPSLYGGETTKRSAEHTTYPGEPKDVLAEFNPTNLAYHPLFRVGKNQPPIGANPAWTGADRRLKSTEGGLKYWGGDATTQYPLGWYEPEGLDNTFVDGWGSKSLVSCSDCHGTNGNTVEGPHGSSYKWLLKGSDPNVQVTTANGVITPNTLAYWGTAAGTPQATAQQADFCINCHRADVYGPGYGASGTKPGLSRFAHQKNASDADSDLTSGKGNKLTPYGCTNCHGGAETGGIHGTVMPAQSGFTDPSGKRFMNGASWAGHNLGTTSVTCTTAPSNNINSCTQHSRGSSGGTLNYSY